MSETPLYEMRVAQREVNIKCANEDCQERIGTKSDIVGFRVVSYLRHGSRHDGQINWFCDIECSVDACLENKTQAFRNAAIIREMTADGGNWTWDPEAFGLNKYVSSITTNGGMFFLEDDEIASVRAKANEAYCNVGAWSGSPEGEMMRGYWPEAIDEATLKLRTLTQRISSPL